MAFGLIPGCHVMTDLLTIREKGVLISLLEPHCKLMKCTVAQILQAKDIEGESPSWICLDCGVVCLVEDESRHSFFLRLYCVKRAKLLWEQELYIPFTYTAARTFFHSFPADGNQMGLNFANENEAEEFHLTVDAACEKINSMIDIANLKTASTSEPPDSRIEPAGSLDEGKQFLMDGLSTTLTSTTSSFKDLDPTMRRLLMQARLTEKDLKDKNVVEAVDFIINQFGGLKAVQRELRNIGSVSQTLPRAAGEE
ncbi:neural Wiskott-Aldrich syndrome protein [Stegastes partitus]|uniref:Neural Wiskott-Aldrich syndrome protein n=1 Tax=Stegastes partitus TaxID=144197 RepID=A0A9Y4K310_9TELE|nr:PREDICTED: neural Wiskott-Aldrich syndrome protein-like [Stegastes partitus]